MELKEKCEMPSKYRTRAGRYMQLKCHFTIAGKWKCILKVFPSEVWFPNFNVTGIRRCQINTARQDYLTGKSVSTTLFLSFVHYPATFETWHFLRLDSYLRPHV
jgi:hypothetical protein